MLYTQVNTVPILSVELETILRNVNLASNCDHKGDMSYKQLHGNPQFYFLF